MTSIPKNRSSVGKGAIWRAMEGAGSEGLSFVAFTLLARQLVPDDFGAIALAMAVLSLAQSLLQHGLTEAIVQRENVTRSHIRAAATINLLVACGLILVGFACAWILPILLHRDSLRGLILALLPTLVFRAGSMTMLASLRREMDFRSIAIRTLLGIVSGAAVALVMARNGQGVWALVAQQWVVEIVGFICLSVSASHKPWDLGTCRQSAKELLPVAIPIAIAHFISNSIRRLDILVLAHFLTDRDLGIYFLINRLILAAQLLTQHGFADVMLTPLSRMAGRVADFQSAAEKTLTYGFLGSCLGLGLLSAVGPDLIPFAFGEEWRSAQTPLKFLAALSCANAILVLCGVVLMAFGRASSFARLTSLAAIFQFVLLVVGAQWGLLSVVCAVGAGQVFMILPAIASLRRYCGLAVGRIWKMTVGILCLNFVALAVAEVGRGLWNFFPFTGAVFLTIFCIGALVAVNKYWLVRFRA